MTTALAAVTLVYLGTIRARTARRVLADGELRGACTVTQPAATVADRDSRGLNASVMVTNRRLPMMVFMHNERC